MEFLFEKENKNFEDYSSGRVLLNMQNTTGFPVRLASEIFQRGLSFLSGKEKINIYDPCSGGGYLLTCLGLIHGEKINKIYASDIDLDILKMSEGNLKLLSLNGIDDRIKQIQNLIELYNKDSHKNAIKSALKIKNSLQEKEQIGVKIFKKNIFDNNFEKIDEKIDMIFSDLPYGNIVNWKDEKQIENLLISLSILLNSGGIIILISNKKIQFNYSNFSKVKLLKHGKRFIYMFQKNNF